MSKDITIASIDGRIKKPSSNNFIALVQIIELFYTKTDEHLRDQSVVADVLPIVWSCLKHSF